MKTSLIYRFIVGILLIAAGVLFSFESAKIALGKHHNFLAGHFLRNDKDLLVEPAAKLALNFDPDNNNAVFYLGSLYRKQKRWNDSIEYLEKALKTSSHPSNVMRELAEVYSAVKQYDKAFDMYYQSLIIDPVPLNNPDSIYYSLGYSAYSIRNFSYAIKGFSQSIQYSITPSTSLPYLTELYLKNGYYVRGKYFLNLDIVGDEKNQTKQNRYFQVFYNSRKFDVGEEFFRILDEKKYLDRTGKNLYASILYLNKKYDESLKIAEQVKSDFPDNPEAYMIAGRIYETIGQTDKMKENYRKYLELAPNSPQKAEFEQKIK